MGKFGEKQRRATDVIHEVRVGEQEARGAARPAHRAPVHYGWRDVLWITGALGLGMALGRLGERQLKGNWRAVPVAVGLVLSIAARSTDPRRTRFARKDAMAVGGLALMTSTIHFTMQARIDADRTLEA